MQKFLTGALAAVSTAALSVSTALASPAATLLRTEYERQQQALRCLSGTISLQNPAFWSLPFFWRSIWSGSCAGICASGTRQTVSTGR